MANRNWRLPAGVDEWLPPAARALEMMRRTVLDVFHRWGYQYIEPPIIEYVDALLVGAGDDLDLQTLKAVDQRSGHMLGVRADMTAQAVRVDAHSLPVEGVQRLCYAGNIVFANPLSALDTRVPLKAGAELFGATTLAADAEVVSLMVEVLAAAGISEPIVVLGHMGIYQSLIADLELSAADASALFWAMQSKAESDIRGIVGESPVLEHLVRLPGLMGERDVLERSRRELASAGAQVTQALDELEALANLVRARCPDTELRFDLAELAGYGYHNGSVFSAYHADRGQALARGGRYDGIGAGFGHARPATGFDVSLKQLVSGVQAEDAIWAPWVDNIELLETQEAEVRRLRAAGEQVVAALAAGESPPAHCARELALADGGWRVDAIPRTAGIKKETSEKSSDGS